MYHGVRQLTKKLLIDRYEKQAPDRVKTYSAMARFLRELKEEKNDALEKIGQYAEELRQQKYNAAGSLIFSAAPRHVASLTSSPHAECHADIECAAFPGQSASESTRFSEIQSSTFDESTRNVAAASDAQLLARNGSTSATLNDSHASREHQQCGTDVTSAAQSKSHNGTATVTRIHTISDKQKTSSFSEEKSET